MTSRSPRRAAQSNPGAGVVRLCRARREYRPARSERHRQDAPRDRVRTDCRAEELEGTLHDGCRSRHRDGSGLSAGPDERGDASGDRGTEATDHRRDRLSAVRTRASQSVLPSHCAPLRKGLVDPDVEPRFGTRRLRATLCSPPPCSTGSCITRPSFRSLVRATGSRTSAAPASWRDPTKRRTKRKTSDHIVLASGTWRRRGWVRFTVPISTSPGQIQTAVDS